MEISKNKGLCGFQPYEFRSLLEGNTLVTGYTYKNRKIKDLLISDGEDYIYEDDDVILYTPTEITEDALFSFIIKKKFLVYENNTFYFYTNFNLDQSGNDIDVIMIQAQLKNNENECFTWIDATIDYTIQTLQTLSGEKSHQYYPEELAFYLSGYYGFNTFNNKMLLRKLISIAEVKDVPSNAMTGKLFL
ncbi:hypothetical protein [uncultured Chryseobacterium sp.]|uniref:hypothetical protein n=1 Tax=uncultured Chryseobacterium sp. TaxID=259322 RepID=UPI0025DDF7CC|nr:hypothetical protein [uncultured Chryseobacterium sp.]